MRVHVYAEELLGEVEVVEQTSRQGETFYGLRIWLATGPSDDDDRSAVTFWARSREELRNLVSDMHEKVYF